MQHLSLLGSVRLRLTVVAALAGLVTLASTATGVAIGASPHAYQQARLAAGGPGSGDVPDNAVYLRYKGKGFSIEYIEGWLQTTTAHGMIFNDKDSSVTVELRPRAHGSLTAYIQRVDLPHLTHAAGFVRGVLTKDSIAGVAAMRLTYRGRSAPDPVTGKIVTLQSDRYYVSGAHALAVITLSTPLGVDNVDAFHRIAHSFSFR